MSTSSLIGSSDSEWCSKKEDNPIKLASPELNPKKRSRPSSKNEQGVKRKSKQQRKDKKSRDYSKTAKRFDHEVIRHARV